jgi:fructose/tagatose bisphosphate aldolase
MPLLTTAHEVRALYREAAELGYLIPGLGVENTDTLEYTLRAALAKSRALGVPDLPIAIGFTGRYSERTQLANYTSFADPREGLLAVGDDLRRLLRPDGPFADLRVHAHFDHGQPGIDEDLFELGRDFVGSVMFDASTYSLEENRERTRRFVEANRDTFLVEGCVDEIPAEGAEGPGEDDLTKPEDAKRFLEETGVDLIVVNVGTEHRATHDTVRYHDDRARAIGEVAHGRMVLHGGSSLGATPLRTIVGDGFVRFNLWTASEKTGGWALARDTLAHLGEILPPGEVRELVEQGVLGESVLANLPGPDLRYLTHVHRRDEAWGPALLTHLDRVLDQCCYERLRSCG